MAKKAELDILEFTGEDIGEQATAPSEEETGKGRGNATESFPPQEGPVPKRRWDRKKVLLLSACSLLLLSAVLGYFFKYREVPAPGEAVLPDRGISSTESISRWIRFHELVIPVKDSEGRDRILCMDLTVEIESPGETVKEEWMRQRRYDIYRNIRQASFAVPVSSPNRKMLKETLHRSLSPYFGADGIKGIYITKLVFL